MLKCDRAIVPVLVVFLWWDLPRFDESGKNFHLDIFRQHLIQFRPGFDVRHSTFDIFFDSQDRTVSRDGRGFLSGSDQTPWSKRIRY